MLRSEPVPILMYHEVADAKEIGEVAKRTQRGYILTREDFEQQVLLMKRLGFASISLRQLRAAMTDGAPLPEMPIVLTFDDGFAGNHRHALPILREHGMTAAFFVVTRRIGDPLMMTWPQLGEMLAAGMEIESHTANHPLLSTVDHQRTQDEFAQSKAQIESQLGNIVQFLSLPNGDRNAYYRQVAVDCGYTGVCGSRFGYNVATTDAYDMRRIAVKQNTGIGAFRGLIEHRFSTIFSDYAKAAGKAAVTRALGKRTYDRLYNLAFGVQEQDKSKQL